MKSMKDIPTVFQYLLIILIGAAVFMVGMQQFNTADGWQEYISAGFFTVLGIIVPLALIYAMLTTAYTFEEDCLQLKSGIFATKIKYSNIFVIKDSRRFFALFSMSTKRLEITHKDVANKSNPWAHAYVSPTDADAFIKELKKHCKSLKVVRAEPKPNPIKKEK